MQITGLDISEHGINNATQQIRPYLIQYKAQDPLPFGDEEFDLVISLGTFHNLCDYLSYKQLYKKCSELGSRAT